MKNKETLKILMATLRFFTTDFMFVNIKNKYTHKMSSSHINI